MDDKYSSSTSKRGIAMILTAIMIVIIIAVVGIGAYVILAGTGTSSTPTTYTMTTGSILSNSTSSIVQSSASFSSSSGSSTAVTTASCSTISTSTTATSAASVTQPDYSNLFGNFSAMTVQYGSDSQTSTSSYTVVSSNSTAYQVDVTISSGSTNESGTGWFLKNGGAATQVTITSSGQTQTYVGQLAQEFAPALMAAFLIQVEENAQISAQTSTSFVHTTGTTAVTLGPTKMTVTNYTAITNPFTYSYCGTNSTVSNLVVSAGTVPGTNFQILTYIAETIASGNSTTSISLAIESITVV
ncbi:MAG: hypothetical protein ACYCPW_00535 [Nitrososphaerales archaeon]